MTHSTLGTVWRIALALLGGLIASPNAQADALSAVAALRLGGCGGTLPAASAVRHDALLDHAAEFWAGGRPLAAAIERSGYAAEQSAAVHITGPESSAIALLRQAGCRAVMDPRLHEIGLYRRGADTWIVLAAGVETPARSQAPVLAARALELVNQARARGRRCGEHSFGPAPPLRESGTLADVALGHAVDMARHNYFEHEDRSGRSPADRVRAVGYAEKLVGENIAYGPKTAEDVVQGWLDSPGHCENIMDPRFVEMGIAYAADPSSSRRGLYWVQVLAAPRA